MAVISILRFLWYIALLATVCVEVTEQRHDVKNFLSIHRQERGRRHVELPVFRHCPNGYTRYNNSCYIIREALVSWTDAFVFCEAFGGHLAYIKSDKEQLFMTGFLNRTANPGATDPAHYYWIGGSDAVTEGEWFWVPALKLVKNTHWGPGNPSSYHQDCMALYSSGLWDDGYCETKHNFICEIQLEMDEGQIIG